MSGNTEPVFDLFVVGGGINGTGIANDAAGRGLAVGLCEQDDLGSATSSASSKLIHGGLRYLEHREFRLVREALREREILLSKAPHIVWPLRFILPHQPHLRPAWMIRAGLFLYDHLSKRDSLPSSRSLRLPTNGPLKAFLKHGFEYSDCCVDDARLVILNAMQAHQQGAEILPRTRCIAARQEGDYWALSLEDRKTGETATRYARVLVNATGPWVESFLRRESDRQSRYAIRMIQGSHLIVPRLHDDKRAYILQHHDGRIVFVLPYHQEFSLVGTTDKRYTGEPSNITASKEEIAYLLDVVNHHFKRQLEHGDVVATFSGVRPLCDDESTDPSVMTRDYTLDLDENGPPLLSVFGGKITTYRKLAETVLEMLSPNLPPMGAAWTAAHPLPGGDIVSQERFTQDLLRQFPFLDTTQAERYAASYGSLCLRFLDNKRDASELGEAMGGGLTSAEIDYLVEHEWAQSVEDIVWRRTKLGLRLTPLQIEHLTRYLATRRQPQAA